MRINEVMDSNQRPSIVPAQDRPRKKKTKKKEPSIFQKLIIHIILLTGPFLILSSAWTATITTPGEINSRQDALCVILFASLFLPLIVEFIYRLLLGVREFNNYFPRYRNGVLELLKDVFYYPSVITTFIFCITLATGIYIGASYNRNPWLLYYNLGPTTVFLSILGSSIFTRDFKLNCGPLYNFQWVQDSGGLDYASCMAHSYFHGYLKLVLPKTGSHDKYLEDFIIDYEGTHHVKIEYHCLFVLIPKSLHCPTSLKDKCNPSIEESPPLPEKQLNIAGVQKRSYKNSVYKINANGKRTYVCAEYATPLKTFKDVCDTSSQHAENYKKHKNDILLKFYLTLKKILEQSESCKQYCELVFYDDLDEQGRRKDVGEILLKRIKKLRSRDARLKNCHNNNF